MRKPDGDLATNDAENLSVLAPFYEKLYNRSSSYDPTVIDELPAQTSSTHLAGSHTPAR